MDAAQAAGREAAAAVFMAQVKSGVGKAEAKQAAKVAYDVAAAEARAEANTRYSHSRVESICVGGHWKGGLPVPPPVSFCPPQMKC